ncbi:MAG: aminopeptidase P family protein [Chloroflexi bacterium]|nr:aminopeptidase P family protein [Chloroflexota bacterium]
MDREELFPRFSAGEYAQRYARVRAAMREQGVDALLLYGHRAGSAEVQYLSNFLATWAAMLVFPLSGEPTLLVQLYNHVPNARRVAVVADVRFGGEDLCATTAGVVRELEVANRRLGLVGQLPYRQYEALRQALPEATLVDWTRELLALRLIKSEEEFEWLRRGAELSDRAIEALAREARPGLSEHELADIVERAYVSLGGTHGIHFLAVTSMQAPDRCVPAQTHSRRRVQRGDVLLTEISAGYHGYTGQILRPFTFGEPPTPHYQRLYEVCVEAFQRVVAAVRPGATTDAVLDAAEYIHAQGYTICDDLLHGYGGGYLPPVLRTRQTATGPMPPLTFREGMAIVIQPNVITPDERSGVQVGELGRVTAQGWETLHRYPLRFIECRG